METIPDRSIGTTLYHFCGTWVCGSARFGNRACGRGTFRVVPPGFYFQGQSAPTQMRNAAAARLGATDT